MSNDYAVPEDVKLELPDAIPSSDGSYDPLLQALIERASRLIDRFTRREPGSWARSSTDTETRYYDGSGSREQFIDSIVAAPTLVAVSETGSLVDSDYTTYASTDYYLHPYNAAALGEPYTSIILDTINGSRSVFYRFPRSVKITAAFGYSDTDNTPPEITQATIIQVARWFGRARQGWADTGAIAELGQLTYTKKLDPEIQEILDHLKRMVI